MKRSYEEQAEIAIEQIGNALENLGMRSFFSEVVLEIFDFCQKKESRLQKQELEAIEAMRPWKERKKSDQGSDVVEE